MDFWRKWFGILAVVVLTGGLVALPGCGDDDGDDTSTDTTTETESENGGTDTETPEPELTGISLLPDSLTLLAESTAEFAVLGEYDDGSSQQLTGGVTLESSDTSVATVSGFTVTGVAEGNATITATYETFSAEATVEVKGPPNEIKCEVLTVVALDPDSSIFVGQTANFTAECEYTDESRADVTSQVVWTSGKPAVMSISNDPGTWGMGVGLQPGELKVWAEFTNPDNSKVESNRVDFTVVADEVATITVAPSTSEIVVGATAQFSAACTFASGNEADCPTLTWASSNEEAATVDASGLATGVAAGEAKITASVGAVTSNEATLTVVAVELESIQITPAVSVKSAIGATQQYAATCNYAGGGSLDCTTSATWASSDTAIATINEDGLATTQGIGTAFITATLDEVTSNQASLTVDVDNVCTSVAIEPQSPAALPLGAKAQFQAVCTLTDGSTRVVTNDATWAWTAGDPAGALASIAGGLADATGGTAGVVQITATVAVGEGEVVSSPVSLTITAATVTSLVVAPKTASIPVQGTVALSAVAIYSDGSRRDVEDEATWASSNTAVATVAAGVVTGVAANATPATITATLGGQSDTAQVTVTAATLIGINVTATQTTAAAGSSDVQFTARGTYNNGTTRPITTEVTWSSSNAAVATVGANTGLVTPVAAGNATITATLGGQSGSLAFTVTDAVVDSIAITTTGTGSIPAGTTREYTASCTYTDDTTGACPAGLTWASDATSVATISSTGVATGVAAGTAQITATASGVDSNALTLTVTDAVLSSIQVSTETGVSQVFVGQEVQFIATGVYSDGDTDDLTNQVTWSSSDTDALSIGAASGLALGEAVSDGAVTVTATYAAASLQGTLAVTVVEADLLSLTISPVSATIAEEEPIQFTATGNYRVGDRTVELDVTGMVEWRVTGGGSFDDDVPGFYTAPIIGEEESREVFVDAVLDGIEPTYDSIITVERRTLESVQIVVEETVLPVGFSIQATCLANYTNGAQGEVTEQSSWTSSVTTVATVNNTDAKGFITAIGPGTDNTTTIRCEYTHGGVTRADTQVMEVYNCGIESIAITNGEFILPRGLSKQLEVEADFAAPCGVYPLDPEMATWTSSNESRAVVDGSGMVSAPEGAQAGVVTITARLDDDPTILDETTVTVTDACIDELRFTGGFNENIPIGPDVPLTVEAQFSDGTWDEIDADQLTFVTQGLGTLTVGADGVVNGVAEILDGDDVPISEAVTASISSGTCTGQAVSVETTFTVRDWALSGIEILPNTAEVPIEETAQFRAWGDYGDATYEITNLVTWRSSIQDVARINTTGLATAESVVGSTLITAALEGQVGTANMQVVDKVIDSLTVSVSPVQPADGYPAGVYIDFACTATYNDGSTGLVTASASFASDDASVVPSGFASTRFLTTADGDGEANVTCSVGDVSDEILIEVNAATLSSIAVTPAGRSINKGMTQQFEATGTYSNGDTYTLTKLCAWSTSDAGVATISNNYSDKGKATAKYEETSVVIRCIYGGREGTQNLTIRGSCVDSISIDPVTATVAAGPNFSVNFSAEVSFSDDDQAPVDVTTSADWSSSNTAVATISSSGKAVGVTAGDGPVTITVRYSDNICTTVGEDFVEATAQLTVTEGLPTAVRVSCPETNLPPYYKVQCTAVADFTDGRIGDTVTDLVTWTSRLPGVATVSNEDGTKGVVTAVAAGDQAGIQASLGDAVGVQYVDVAECTLSSVTISTGDSNIPQGFTAQYAATGVWSGTCGSKTITDFVELWGVVGGGDDVTIDDAGLATVATDAAAGNYTVQATFGGEVGQATLTVNDAVLQSITIEDPNDCLESLPLSRTCQLRARGTFSDMSSRLVTSEVTWSVATGNSVTVNSSGLVTASDEIAGPAVIKAKKGTIENTAEVNVTEACLESIVIEQIPDVDALPVDVPVQFKAWATSSDGTTSEITGDVAWSSDNTGYVGIPDSEGKTRTVGEGVATISAQVTSNTCTGAPVEGELDVTVVDEALVAIQIYPQGAEGAVEFNLPQGLTKQFVAMGTYEDIGEAFDITDRVTWFSGNPLVAEISGGGLVTAVAEGFSVIEANLGLLRSNTVDVEVSDGVVDELEISVTNPYVGYSDGDVIYYPEGGLDLQLEVVGYYSDGDVRVAFNDVVTYADNFPGAEDLVQPGVGLFTTPSVEADTVITVTVTHINRIGETIEASIDITVVNGMPSDLLIENNGHTSVAVDSKVNWDALAVLGDRDYIVTRNVNWQSLTPLVATVGNGAGDDEDWGEITGETAGIAAIQIGLFTLTASQNITVTP